MAVSRREVAWVMLWAAVVMALTCWPYFQALKVADGRFFSGFLWGVDEGNVYLAWMRQAAEGELFLRNQYCVAPENPRFLNLFFQLGGRLSALTGLPPIMVFHGLRVLGGLFLLWSFYLLLADITRDRVVRWAALLLASLGSGYGWLVVLYEGIGGLRPIDVGWQWQIQPEAVTFPSLLLNGLFVTAMGLMCQVLRLSTRAIYLNDTRLALMAGLLLLILGNIHTYNVFPVHLTLTLWLLWEIYRRHLHLRIAFKQYALIFILGLPAILWALYAAQADPAFMAKGLTPTLAARLVDYVTGYGLIGMFAGAGLVLIIYKVFAGSSQRQVTAGIPAVSGDLHLVDANSWLEYKTQTLPVCWVMAGSLVLLIPVSFQRKMIEGLHLPLCILAGLAATALAYRLTKKSRDRGKLKEARERTVLTLIAITALSLPSNALLVAQCLGQLRNNNANLAHVLQPPLFLEASEASALEWLSYHSTSDDVVLSSSFIGSFIPTRSPARAWVGHWAETLALVEADQYLLPTAPLTSWDRVGEGIHLARFGDNLRLPVTLYGLQRGEDMLQVLRKHPVTLVYYGSWEQAMTTHDRDDPQVDINNWKSEAARMLEVVYEADGVTIYRVPLMPGVSK